MSAQRVFSLVFCLLIAGTASAASYHSDGRCRDGCNYYGGEAAHIGVVEKYHLGKARDKLRSKFYGPAMNDINFMLRHFPNHPQALMLLDEAGRGQGQPNLALRYFKAAIDAYPNEGMTYLTYGMFLQKRGKLADAIEQYQLALKMNPNLPDGHYNLGLALVASKRYAEANEHALAAYRLGHPMPGLRNQLQRVGAWNPDAAPEPVAVPSAAAAAPSAPESPAAGAPPSTKAAAPIAAEPAPPPAPEQP